MKRLLKVLGILVLLIVAAAIILPIVFKDEIIARAKTEINKSLTATVDFEDIDISLFRSFPDFSLNIENTTVDGKGPFEGIRLAEVEDFTVDLGLFSVISGNQYEVERIWIKNANIHVVVDTAGNANYNIMKEAEADTTAADTAAASNFQFTLKSYGLENVNLIYDDREGEIFANLRNLKHTGSGDFTEEIVNLSTGTSIEALTVRMEDMTYLDHVEAEMDADFEFNQPEFRITFGENRLRLNELPLQFTGFVAMPEDDIDMDLAFEAPENQFKNVLSLIPAVYQESFADVQTSGDFILNGTVSGTYNGEQEIYPQYDIKFNINEASFRYPDLPAGVENIALDAHIFNETTDLDGTVINIPTARANVAGSPVNARLNLSNPMSNPTFDIYLETDMDLENIGRVIPSDDFDYRGRLRANLDLAGNMNDIDNERYENVKADGEIIANNIVLRSDSLPYDVQVNELNMQFTPQRVVLNSFNSQIGKSDLSANGTINNILAYLLQDDPLLADFSLTSNLLDLNELSGAAEEGEEETTGETADTSQLEIIRIPENLDVRITADVQRILYDNLDIQNTKGTVEVKNGAASLNNLTMDMLDGNVALSGTYDSKPALPMVDLNFKINNFGFKESYDKLVSIQQLAPIMKYSSGTYSTGFTFNSTLQSDMTPDFSTVQASGSLTTRNLETSPKSLEKLASTLNNPSLSTLSLGNLNLDFAINDGRVEVQPFDIKTGNVNATVSGTMGLDQSLDYTMDMQIPVSGIKANDLLDRIGATKGGKANVQVLIGGTFENPTVRTSLSDMVGNVVDNLKEKAQEKIDEVKEDAKEKVNEKAQQLIDDAEKRGDQLIAEAQEQADRIKAEAEKRAQQLRDEADKRASQLEQEAKGNILKEQGAKLAAKKVRDEADQKAQQLISEANKRAQSLVDKARQQKEQLVKEAREKGQVQ